MGPLVLLISALAWLSAAGASSTAGAVAQAGRPLTAPETFTSQVQARSGFGTGSASNIRIIVDRYTAGDDRKAMTDALRHGGYPGFVNALRKAPAVGRVELGDESFIIRWAREEATAKGRVITIVTDTPVYFVGGGRVGAKPREGFELAVIRLTVDDFGTGTGTMAAAARVKADREGDVSVEDYADEPVKLTFVRRDVK